MSKQPKIAIVAPIQKRTQILSPRHQANITSPLGRGISLMKESHTIKFSHLAQESQISYHTNVGKVVYYHILTSIEPNNPNRGHFKIFIPSSKFLYVFPKSLSDLMANLEIQSELLKNSLVTKATLSFPTINKYQITVRVHSVEISEFFCHSNFT